MEDMNHFDNERATDVDSDYEVTISTVTIYKKSVFKFTQSKYKEEENDPGVNQALEQGVSCSKCCMNGATPSAQPTIRRIKLPNKGTTAGESNSMKPIAIIKPIPKVMEEPKPPIPTTEMDEISDPNENANEDGNENETNTDGENQRNHSFPRRAISTILNAVGNFTLDVFMWMCM
jgi:hypothetical protein